MRYFLDTEFYERPGRITLISIGLVAEDGREYYRENGLFDWARVKDDATLPGIAGQTPRWLLENVRPHLIGDDAVNNTEMMKQELLEFCRPAEIEKPQFWGYFADYDWVAFCWIFGSMVSLPSHFPKYCLDLKQRMKELRVTREFLPKNGSTEHNALSAARWHRDVAHYLDKHEAAINTINRYLHI